MGVVIGKQHYKLGHRSRNGDNCYCWAGKDAGPSLSPFPPALSTPICGLLEMATPPTTGLGLPDAGRITVAALQPYAGFLLVGTRRTGYRCFFPQFGSRLLQTGVKLRVYGGEASGKGCRGLQEPADRGSSHRMQKLSRRAHEKVQDLKELRPGSGSEATGKLPEGFRVTTLPRSLLVSDSFSHKRLPRRAWDAGFLRCRIGIITSHPGGGKSGNPPADGSINKRILQRVAIVVVTLVVNLSNQKLQKKTTSLLLPLSQLSCIIGRVSP